MEKNRILAAGAVAAIALSAAACSSGSSSSSHPAAGSYPASAKAAASAQATAVSGIETFSGTIVMTAAQASSSHFVPTIPLTAAGAFSDTGSIYLTPGSGANGNGPGPAVIRLAGGTIAIHHDATPDSQQPVPVGPASACTFGLTQKTAYRVTGGTGKYKGTSGRGIATITFDFTVARLASGKCDTAGSAPATGGEIRFSAAGPVTVP